MYKIFLIILSCSLSANVVWAKTFQAGELEDCGSTSKIFEVRIPGCEELPCELQKGQSYGVEIDFQPQSPDLKLTAVVTGIIMRMEVPWPGGVKPNACNDLVKAPGLGRCPYNFGERLIYGVRLNVLRFYPSISVVSKWRLYDSQKRNHVCLLIPVKIR